MIYASYEYNFFKQQRSLCSAKKWFLYKKSKDQKRFLLDDGNRIFRRGKYQYLEDSVFEFISDKMSKNYGTET